MAYKFHKPVSGLVHHWVLKFCNCLGVPPHTMCVNIAQSCVSLESSFQHLIGTLPVYPLHPLRTQQEITWNGWDNCFPIIILLWYILLSHVPTYHAVKACMWCWDKCPHVTNLGAWLRWVVNLTTAGRAFGSRWFGSWVDPKIRSGHGDGRPARCQSPHWLSYPGFVTED
jgi:hypothetical protein